jgi:hypothetical protein
MKQYEIKVEYITEHDVTVVAESEEEAFELAQITAEIAHQEPRTKETTH